MGCQEKSVTIEHAEPWNNSQAQLLMFHVWRYLHSALLKGFFICFVFFLLIKMHPSQTLLEEG